MDGSGQSLAAVRLALTQARCRGTELRVVYARPPVEPHDLALLVDLPTTGSIRVVAAQQRARTEATIRDAEGRALIAAALAESVGGMPRHVAVHPVVAVGEPGPALVAQAWSGDDLLVLGTRGGQRWHHLRRGSISHYCIRHAACPVLLVPNDNAHYTAVLENLQHDLQRLGQPNGPAEPARA